MSNFDPHPFPGQSRKVVLCLLNFLGLWCGSLGIPGLVWAPSSENHYMWDKLYEAIRGKTKRGFDKDVRIDLPVPLPVPTPPTLTTPLPFSLISHRQTTPEHDPQTSSPGAPLRKLPHVETTPQLLPELWLSETLWTFLWRVLKILEHSLRCPSLQGFCTFLEGQWLGENSTWFL